MIEFCSLASGSNGNCYYIGDDTKAILFDVGLSFARFKSRIQTAKLDIGKIKAIFITHEHHDHSYGARVISNKLQVPVYATELTFGKMRKNSVPHQKFFLNAESETLIDDIKVISFPKNHDAADPISFRVEIGGKNIGVMTDIGVVDEVLEHNFGLCDAVFLESNYDNYMLLHGRYPDYLKLRVASEKGHLSNDQAFDLVENFASVNLSHLIISHVSEENNTNDHITAKFAPLISKYKFAIASRYECSEVFRID